MKTLWAKLLTWCTKWVMQRRMRMTQEDMECCGAQLCLHDEVGTVVFPCMREPGHPGEHCFGSKKDQLRWFTHNRAKQLLTTTFRRDR